MRILLILLALLFILLQMGTTYIWVETDTLEHFTRSFELFYDAGIQYWSRLAFSLGAAWYILSLVMLLGVLVSLVKREFRLLLPISVAGSVISTAAMWYAMYPLHLIFGGGFSL